MKVDKIEKYNMKESYGNRTGYLFVDEFITKDNSDLDFETILKRAKERVNVQNN